MYNKFIFKYIRRFQIHPFTDSRLLTGQSYISFADSRENPKKFFSYFRRSAGSIDELEQKVTLEITVIFIIDVPRFFKTFLFRRWNFIVFNICHFAAKLICCVHKSTNNSVLWNRSVQQAMHAQDGRRAADTRAPPDLNICCLHRICGIATVKYGCVHRA